MRRQLRVAIILASFIYRIVTAHEILQHQTAYQLRTTRKTNFVPASVLESHSDDVEFVCLSPDGTILASGSLDGDINLWDMDDDGALISTINGSGGSIRSLAFSSPDGSILVSGGGGYAGDSTVIHVYEKSGNSYEFIGNFNGHASVVWSVSFSPDGSQLASGSFDSHIFVWDMDLDNDSITLDLGNSSAILDLHQESVYSVSYSLDGTRLASASRDRTIIIWDMEDQVFIKIFFGHTDAVNSVVFSPDGTKVASASDDKTIRIWDVQNYGNYPLHVLTGHTFNVESVCFSRDGTKLASGSFDKTIRIWDAENDYTLIQIIEGHTDWVNSVTFNSDGSKLFSGSSDKTVRIWEDTEASEASEAPSGAPSTKPSTSSSATPSIEPSATPSIGPSTISIKTAETSSAPSFQTVAAAKVCIIAFNVFLGLFC